MIVIIGRFVGSLGLVVLLKLCCKYDSGLNLKDLIFISFCGVIRGAIAFGLVLRLDNSLPNRELIVTTSYIVVVVTTIFFGSIVGYGSKFITKHEPIASSSKLLETIASEAEDDVYRRAQENGL